MQATFQSNKKPASTTSTSGFKPRAAVAASAPASSSSAGGASGPGGKKTSGEVVFRVKRKGVDGEINQNGQPTKWVTVGNLYKNTDLASGDIFYSFQAKEDISAGIHRVFDATAPVGAAN